MYRGTFKEHRLSDDSDVEILTTVCKSGQNVKLTEQYSGKTVEKNFETVCLAPRLKSKRAVPKSIRSDFISESSDSDDDDGIPFPAKMCRVSGQGRQISFHQEKENLKFEKKIEREKRQREKEEQRMRKQEEQLQKKREREIKKKELEREKLQKRAVMAIKKSTKPGECLKVVSAMISPGVLKNSAGSAILDILQKNEIKYDIQSQIHDDIITVWREITEFNSNGEMMTSEIVEDNVLMLMPIDTFIRLVDAFTISNEGRGAHAAVEDLQVYVENVKISLEGRKVTVLVQGIEKYFRSQANNQKREFKAKVMEGAERNKKKATSNGVSVTRLDVESALVQLQLETQCSVKFVESEQEMAKLVFCFVKAIAETPHKRDRLVSGFSFHMESGGAVFVDKEGRGLSAVWRQQIQQFKNVTAEVANTIMAAYPSPMALHKAYSQCQSEKEAERLLQDLEVRRGAGVMSTSRRIGKELSRRMYVLMTSKDPSVVLT